jgi:hypothetical protein
MPKKKKTRVKKVKKAPSKRGDAVTFVRVDDPSSLRREILEGAIETAELLKIWESYHKLKSQKAEIFRKLTLIFSKIDREANSLRKFMPKLPEVKEEKKVKVPSKAKPEKVYTGELDQEISDISSKLKGLNI